ncbi:hypothetical protein PHYBOEH_002838 [Phytophthora boehmeriae]|uniref:Uncharacterized protein n=1 Tax=Phytophthora boehmeriae TaxID=109152 RepID=A0A8T1WQ77_9STRA|nr:hypothetical protein PHYBOEH_002838 [Phytophthora boehmeriae]
MAPIVRARSSTPSIDPLFEFDAPQQFLDLTATASPFPAGSHDPWFDQVHPEHSKPSSELAKDLAETVRRLQRAEEAQKTIKKDKHRVSVGKENRRPSNNWRDIVKARNKQLQTQNKRRFQSLKEMRAAAEPFQVKKIKTEVKSVERQKKRRKPLADVGNTRQNGDKRDKAEKSLKQLLAKHNEKFKATHTYEPPKHSIREVKQWERETNKSFYALSAEERVQANEDIKLWKQRRAQESRSH